MSLQRPPPTTHTLLTEAQEAEVQFQRKKFKSREAQALFEGSLRPAEETPATHNAMRAWRAQLAKDILARQRAKARSQKNIQGATPADVMSALRGASVYVSAELRTPALAASIAARGITIAPRLSAAQHAICSFPCGGTRIRLAMLLRGAYHIDPKFIMQGTGPAIKYMSAAAGNGGV